MKTFELVVDEAEGEDGGFQMVAASNWNVRGEEEEGSGEETDFRMVSELERCLAIDSAALLGGNEYLVQQLIESGVTSKFTPAQEAALHFSMAQLWGEPDEGMPKFTAQEARFGLLFPQHRDRLPHILASCLLYCGRHPVDTKMVALPTAFPDTRLLLLNMSNYRSADPPIGRTPTGALCCRLAVLYHWAGNGKDMEEEKKMLDEKPSSLMVRVPTARKLSNSLVLEQRMLDVMDVFAVFACP